MIEAKALRWLLIVIGIIVFTITVPPIGVLLILGLFGCFGYRMVRGIRRKAAERAAQRQIYWRHDTITRRYYS